jgi:hypothetical protein
LHKLTPRNQLGRRLARDNGEQDGIGTALDGGRQEIEEAAQIDAAVKIWRSLHTGIPAWQTRRLDVNLLQLVSEVATEATSLSALADLEAWGVTQ